MTDSNPPRPGTSSRTRRKVVRSAEIDVNEVPVFEGSFIVAADGSVQHASLESRVWLGVRGFDAAMTKFVASLASAGSPAAPGVAKDNPFAPFAEASGVRLIGADSLLRFHVRVRPILRARSGETSDSASAGAPLLARR